MRPIVAVRRWWLADAKASHRAAAMAISLKLGGLDVRLRGTALGDSLGGRGADAGGFRQGARGGGVRRGLLGRGREGGGGVGREARLACAARAMIVVRLSSDLDKMARAVERQQGRVLRAIAQGLNEGGDLVRTQVRAAMREQTGLRQLKSVTSRERGSRAYAVGQAPKSGTGPSRPAGLAYTIIYVGKPPTKPKEFEINVEKGPGGGVTVWMWNVAHKFKRSFQQKFRGGLRMRRSRERHPIRGFDGPNLAKEAVTGQVARTFLAQSAALVPSVIEKRLGRAL